MRLLMRVFALGALACLMATAPQAQTRVVVGTTARAGPVVGTKENSDAFIWKLFVSFVKPTKAGAGQPVEFETWASDADTFSTNPHWPSPGEAMKFQTSFLAEVRSHGVTPAVLGAAIDVACKAPPGAASGGFPTTGTPTPCVAEQVQRNRAQYDYIVGHKLNTKAGLAAAFKSSQKIDMPTASVAIKADWVPVTTLMAWIPSLKTQQQVEQQFLTTTDKSVEYALVAMHVASRQNPNWVWGTFEHELVPGRCDYLGCLDSFGATKPVVLPNRTQANAPYGACVKSAALKAVMAKGKVSDVWNHFCLKSTEVAYTSADGTPYVLGNSVIEGITGNGTVAASSCIGCHVYASFGSNGAPTTAATNILPFNPTGNPIPTVLKDSKQFSFMWGVLLAP